MFDISHYRVNIKGKMVKNLFIYHSVEAMNDFYRKMQFFGFLMIDIFPSVRPIKHLANFPGIAMVISIFYYKPCVSRNKQKT